jgi:hypothetical protein
MLRHFGVKDVTVKVKYTEKKVRATALLTEEY